MSARSGDGKATIDLVVLPLEAHLLASQERSEHRQILAHVGGRRGVGKAVQSLDHRTMRDADAEGQPSAAEDLSGRGLLGQGQRMPRIAGHDADPEFDPLGGHSGHRKGGQRVVPAGEVYRPG